jgi:hypothetical protein
MNLYLNIEANVVFETSHSKVETTIEQVNATIFLVYYVTKDIWSIHYHKNKFILSSTLVAQQCLIACLNVCCFGCKNFCYFVKKRSCVMHGMSSMLRMKQITPLQNCSNKSMIIH